MKQMIVRESIVLYSIKLIEEPEEDDVDSHDIQILDSFKDVFLKDYAARFQTDSSEKDFENGPFLKIILRKY